MANKRRTVGYDMVHGGVDGNWYVWKESKELFGRLYTIKEIKEMPRCERGQTMALIRFLVNGGAAFWERINVDNERATASEIRKAKEKSLEQTVGINLGWAEQSYKVDHGPLGPHPFKKGGPYDCLGPKKRY